MTFRLLVQVKKKPLAKGFVLRKGILVPENSEKKIKKEVAPITK